MAEGVTEPSVEYRQRAFLNAGRALRQQLTKWEREEMLMRYYFVRPGERGCPHPDQFRCPITDWDNYD